MWPFHRKPKTERVCINGEWFDVPMGRMPDVHADGIPVGLRPGDPIDPRNFGAIFDYVQRAAREDQERHEGSR